ncbi:MAG: HesA/MoeB/ThiF family protein [Candidatus Gastranaerophilales bacterium]|nr:HesA/MoeB/ThiF family protein [Candidatus Gastranaerophilales bacterium]
MDRYSKIKSIGYIGEEGFKKIQNARVLILGAGGIGTNTIVNLVSMGVGHIGLVDNDVVEMKNLSIQTLYNEESIGRYKVDVVKEWVEKYNPHIDFKTYNLRLDENNYEDIFKDYDIIANAFDTQKSVHLVNKLAVKTNKPIVFTGSHELEGSILTVIPGKTPCFDCYIERQLKVAEKEYGVTQATGAIVAGLQSAEILKIILDMGIAIHTNPLAFNMLLGLIERPRIYTSKTRKCEVCGRPLISYAPFYN